MPAERPEYYPLHAIFEDVPSITNSLFLGSGYAPNLPIPSGDHNTKFKLTSLWHAHMDCNSIRNADWLDLVTSAKLSAADLTYLNGSNVVVGGATVLTRTVLLLEGTRYETDVALLSAIFSVDIVEPLFNPIAIVPGRIWIYLDGGSGGVRAESVAAGVLDTAAAGEQPLVGVDIDVDGFVLDGGVAPVNTPLPPKSLNVDSDMNFAGALSFAGPVIYDGNVVLNGDVTLGSDSADTILVKGTSSFDELATFDDGVQGPGATALVLTEGAVLPAGEGLLGTSTSPITGGDFASVGTITTTLGIEGAASSPVILSEGATVAATKTLRLESNAFIVAGDDMTVTYGTDAVVTYGADALLTTGSGSTINMVDATSKLFTGAVELDTPVATTPNPGVLQWDGLSLSIGDGSLAVGRRVPAPLDSWIPGDITTMAGNVATGATITLVVRALESIIITFESEMTNDDAVPVVLFNIEVSAVVVGGTANREAPAPGRFLDVSRRVQYTAGVIDELAVIVAFFGASNGTTTARNILLTVRRAN